MTSTLDRLRAERTALINRYPGCRPSWVSGDIGWIDIQIAAAECREAAAEKESEEPK